MKMKDGNWQSRTAPGDDVAASLHSDCNDDIRQFTCKSIREDASVGMSHRVNAVGIYRHSATQFSNNHFDERDIINCIGSCRPTAIAAIPRLIAGSVGQVADSIRIDSNELV